MSKMNAFGFFNIQFETKSVDDNNGQKRKLNFNNFYLDLDGKSLFANAENGSGKTSIFRLLKSQFMPINKAANDNRSISMTDYFKFTQGAYPAIVWSDYISNEDSNRHTLIITYNQLKADVNATSLTPTDAKDALDRYGLIINYKPTENPAPTQDGFGIISKLGLVKLDESGAYIPCQIKDIKQNINDNAGHLTDFDPKNAIPFSKTINTSANFKEFQQVMKQNAYAPNDPKIWSDFYSVILNSEGGVDNLFFKKINNGVSIMRPSEIIKTLYLTPILSKNDKKNEFENLKHNINKLFLAKIQNSEKVKKFGQYKKVYGKLQQLDPQNYEASLAEFKKEKNSEYQAKAKLVYTSDYLNSQLNDAEKDLIHKRNAAIRAEFAVKKFSARDAQKNYDKKKNELVQIAKDGLKNRASWRTIKENDLKNQKIDAQAELDRFKQQKVELKQKQTQSENQKKIDLLQAKLKKYYSSETDRLEQKQKDEAAQEQQLQTKLKQLANERDGKTTRKGELSNEKKNLGKEISDLSSETKNYTKADLENEISAAKTEIKKYKKNISDLNTSIDDNNTKKENIEAELEQKNKVRPSLLEDKIQKKTKFDEAKRKHNIILQLLPQYHDVFELPNDASKDEIISNLKLYADSIENRQRDNISRDLLLKKQLANLKNKTNIDIPKSVKAFLEENRIQVTTGYEYLSSIPVEKAKQVNAKYPFLGFALLTHTDGFQKLKQFDKDTGLESVLIVNQDKLDSINNTQGIAVLGNFDLDFVTKAPEKISDLQNRLTKLENENTKLKATLNTIRQDEGEVNTNFISNDDLIKLKTLADNAEATFKNFDTKIDSLITDKNNLISANKDLKGKIDTAKDNLDKPQEDLEKYVDLLNKLTKLSKRKARFTKIVQDYNKIKSDLKGLKSTIVDENGNLSNLQSGMSQTSTNLKTARDKLLLYKDADLKLVENTDLSKFSAKSAEKKLNELVTNQTTDIRLIDLQIQQANEKLNSLRNDEAEVAKNYKSDIDDFDKFLSKQHITFDQTNSESSFKISVLDKKYKSLYSDFVKQEVGLNTLQKDVKEANKALAKFNKDHQDFDTSFDVSSLYSDVDTAKQAQTKIKAEIKNLVGTQQDISKLLDEINSSIEYVINLNNDKFAKILKSQYSWLKEQVSDKPEMIKDLLAKVKSLNDRNNKLRKRVYNDTLTSWKDANLEHEDFVNIPRVDSENIQKDINSDLTNFSRPNIVATDQQVPLSYSNTIIRLKNYFEQQIESVKMPKILDLQNDAITSSIGLARGMKVGINEIAKNSLVKLDRFEKPQRLIKIIMPRNLPDLDDPEISKQRHNEINTRIDTLYDTFEEKIANKHWDLLKNPEKLSQAKKLLTKFISDNITCDTIFSWAYGNNALDNINFKVLNPYSSKKARYLDWQKEVGTSSGAERLATTITMLIPILRYLSMDDIDIDSDVNSSSGSEQMQLFKTRKQYPGAYLPIDNFTSTATKAELLAPAIEFAEKANIQIIALSQVSATNIADSFDNVVSLSNNSESNIKIAELTKTADSDIDFLSVNFADKLVD